MAQSKKILVIDDEADILDFVARVLSDGGYKVLRAKNAEDGINIMRGETIDLVLLDIMLPQVDGWSVLKIMRSDAGMKNIPVAMLTARLDAHDKVIGLREGAVDYICKPFTADVLLKRVNDIFKYLDTEQSP